MTEAHSNSELDTEPQFVLEFDDHSLLVDQERIRIGSSLICEIRLPHGPMLHSVIRSEAGIIWIEADDGAADLFVNDRICHRMALRDGDIVSVAGCEFTVHQRLALTVEESAARLVNDISRLTADELCDRILSEQSVVDEFESTRRQGWQSLMSAVQDVAAEPVTAAPAEAADEWEDLLEQIREMSEMMNGKALELDDCESELAAATSLLQETQERVSRQIQDLLNQISDVGPTELRASA